PRLLRAAGHLQHALVVGHRVGPYVWPLPALLERAHDQTARLETQLQLRQRGWRRLTFDDESRDGPGRWRVGGDGRRVDFWGDAIALRQRALDGRAILRRHDHGRHAEAVP